MSLLAEEIVEEWLNRDGFFTIRGIKLGVQEIDLLAISVHGSAIDARHIEVQASSRPMSYLCDLPKETQRMTGRKPKSAKMRTQKELVDGVNEWINKKYDHKDKVKLRNALHFGKWKYELVIHRVKFPEELELLKRRGVKIHNLDEITKKLSSEETIIKSAAGADLIDLVKLGQE